MALSDTFLPALVVLLSDITWALRDEAPSSGTPMQLSLQRIEALEAALVESLGEAGRRVSRDTFVSLCRRSPSPRFLDALLVQQEALFYLATQATEESAAYWNEGGDGYGAVELGRTVLSETWWPYRNRLRTWIEVNCSALTVALQMTCDALGAEAPHQEVKGVIEPLVQRLEIYLAQLQG